MQTRRRIQALPSSFNTRYRQQHVQSTYRQPSTREARDALSVAAQLTYTRQALLRHCEIPCRVTIGTTCRRDSERPDIDGRVPVPVRYHESGTASLSVRMPSRAGLAHPLEAASAEHLAMRGVARNPGVPVVLMHSRGDAGVNKDYDVYSGELVTAI
jgi:hypothetical protein